MLQYHDPINENIIAQALPQIYDNTAVLANMSYLIAYAINISALCLDAEAFADVCVSQRESWFERRVSEVSRTNQQELSTLGPLSSMHVGC